MIQSRSGYATLHPGHTGPLYYLWVPHSSPLWVSIVRDPIVIRKSLSQMVASISENILALFVALPAKQSRHVRVPPFSTSSTQKISEPASGA